MRTITTALLISLTFFACGKGGGTPEAALVVTTIPAASSTQAPAPGPTFPLSVTVTSTMPPKGVTISVSVEQDGTSTPFFSADTSTSAATTNFTLLNTPQGEVCDVTVKVTSNTTSTNSWTGTYRYSEK